MEGARLLGIGVFLITCLVVGGRMLLLARRTREIPELALGITLFVSGGLGGVLFYLGSQGPEFLGHAAVPVCRAGILCVTVGAISLWFFTERVFRPDSRWAAALFAAAVILIMVGLFADMSVAGAPDFDQRRWQSPWSVLGFAVRTAAFAWAALESLLYWRILRRRERLGLADPLLVSRFLLWGMSNLAALGIYLVAALHIARGTGDGLSGGIYDSTWAALTSLLGVIAGLCMWMAFFTPHAYRRWIRAEGGITPRAS